MSKKTIIILIILCSPITLFIVGRLTGIFAIFTIKTLSGYPNLQPHDAIITTSLSTPKRGEIIVFKQLTRPEYGLFYNVYDSENGFRIFQIWTFSNSWKL